MPRLNVIAMIVLCLAVAAGAATMAVRTGPDRHDSPRVGRLIRQLGETDPDLRRDAERELKDLGRKAEPALKEAAAGADPVVAERARALLGHKTTEPAKPIATAPAESAVRVTIQIVSLPRRPDEAVAVFVRMHNESKGTVAVAPRMGHFERMDAEGRIAILVPENLAAEESPVTFDLAPGQSADLSPAVGVVKIGASGTFRIRFVYDASAGSEYRTKVAGMLRHGGTALPARRFESNEVAITIP
jgi:hypothetical protein